MFTSLHANGPLPLNIILTGVLTLKKRDRWLEDSLKHMGLTTKRPLMWFVLIPWLVSLALNHGCSLRQLIVCNAPLYGGFTKHVFIEQSLGYVVLRAIAHVCHLDCAIYGLKYSPHT